VARPWVAHNVPQCGYCQSGMIMAAASLLERHPNPTDADIDQAMSNLCRCATYARVRAGIHRAVRIALPVVVGSALSLASVGCHGKTASTSNGAELRIPDQEARDFTLTESSEGRKSWTLWASYAAMYDDQNLVDAQHVRIEFFDSKGNRYSTLLADRGSVHQRTNDLEARGNVRVTTETGVTMETDSLRWLNRTGKIASDAFVRVTRKNDVVTGYGFESDPNLDHFHLTREVRAEVREGEAEPSRQNP
jgi:LPS export ABC transporter protein LptC